MPFLATPALTLTVPFDFRDNFNNAEEPPHIPNRPLFGDSDSDSDSDSRKEQQ